MKKKTRCFLLEVKSIHMSWAPRISRYNWKGYSGTHSRIYLALFHFYLHRGFLEIFFDTIYEKRFLGHLDKEILNRQSVQNEESKKEFPVTAETMITGLRVASKAFANDIIKFLLSSILVPKNYSTGLQNI